MTEKDRDVLERQATAEDGLLAADEGYSEWLDGLDAESWMRMEQEGEAFADRESS